MERDERDLETRSILEIMGDFIVVSLPGKKLRVLRQYIKETRKPYGDLAERQKRRRLDDCVERVETVFKNLKEGVSLDDCELLSKVMVKLLPEHFQANDS